MLARRYTKAKDAGLKDQLSVAIGWLGAEAVRAQLEREFGDGTGTLREVLRAATALHLLGNETVGPALVKRLAQVEYPLEGQAIVATLARLDVVDAGDDLLALVRDEEQPLELRATAVWALGVLSDAHPLDWSAAYANLAYPYLTWTLASPFGDGYGLLDGR